MSGSALSPRGDKANFQMQIRSATPKSGSSLSRSRVNGEPGKGTYVQKRPEAKEGMKLNLNDRDVIGGLKEKLLSFMDMDEG